MTQTSETDRSRTVVVRSATPPQTATIGELVQWCRDEGLDPDAVRLCGGFSASWKSPETDAEYAERLEREERLAEKHRAWLRTRVREVFGVDLPE